MMNKLKVEKALSDLHDLYLTADFIENEYRNMAVGVPEGDKRNRLLTNADIQYHKKLAYKQSWREMSKAVYPDKYRDWRIRKRNKSVTLNINTEKLDRISKAFKSVIANTFNGITPYAFTVQRNSNITFIFDSKELPAEMSDKSRLVVKFNDPPSIELSKASLRRMLLTLDRNTWYNYELLYYNTFYYTT